jgi:hypothetical protein
MRKHDEVQLGNRWSPAPCKPGSMNASRPWNAEADLVAARARHPVRLTSEELAWLTKAGADIRAVFEAPATANTQRKQLIRAVINEITLTIDRQAGTCHALITWQGTATSGCPGRVKSASTRTWCTSALPVRPHSSQCPLRSLLTSSLFG